MNRVFSCFLVILCQFQLVGQYDIDSSFNNTGTNEFTQYAGNVVNGQKLAYTSDDNLIIAGRWNDQLTVWKYTQNGQLDISFGQNGLTALPMPVGVWTLVKDLEIMNDGRILVLADALLFNSANLDYSQCSIVLARLMPDGSVDPSFNGTGLVITRPQAGYEYVSRTLETTENGGIFVGGYASAYGHFSCATAQNDFYAWFLAKFLENGNYDLSFNNSGYLQRPSIDIAQNVFQPVTYNASILDIKQLPDNKILVAGAFNGQDNGYFSARILQDGTYDPSYALNGRSPIHDPNIYFPATDASYAYIQNDQSILFTTQYVNYGTNGNLDTTFVRYYKMNALGSIESTFGINGEGIFAVASNQVRTTFDNNERLIFAWYSKKLNGSQEVGFKRFLSNGNLDISFGSGGNFIHEPILSDPFMNMSVVNDIQFNSDNSDLSIVSFRSANYVPTSFRVLNYRVDTMSNNASLPMFDESELELYPNPFSHSMMIRVTDNWIGANAVMLDELGRVVARFYINSPVYEMHLVQIQHGSYFLILEKEGNQIIKQVNKI
jgi:uncharacterized delta-60 repeat protein